MNRIILYFIFLLFLCLLGCRKDVGLLPIKDINEPKTVQGDTIDFTCVTFPKWFNPPPDSVTFPTKQMMYWQYCPDSKTEVLYTLGTQIWTYNFSSKKRTFITKYLHYLPDCNNKGWILFSDYRDQCVYKVKTNGDSLIRLTDSGLGGGHWNYNGTAIYYFSEPNNMLYKIDENGKKLDSASNIPVQFTAFSRVSDKLYYGKVISGIFSIVCFDALKKKETVMTSSLPSGSMVIDDREENLYIRDFSTLIKYNIPSKKLDTLGKDCDNLLWTWPSISAGTNKVTIGCIFAKFLDPKTDPNIKKPKLLKWTKAFQIDLDDPTHKLEVVNLFP